MRRGDCHGPPVTQAPRHTVSRGVRVKVRCTEVRKGKNPEAKVDGLILVKKNWLETSQAKAWHSQIRIRLCVYFGSWVAGSTKSRELKQQQQQP